METLTRTAEQTSQPYLTVTQDGKMDVYTVDQQGLHPDFEGRVQRDNPDSPSVYADAERGVYGLMVAGEHFAKETYKYASHSASYNQDKLARTTRNAPTSPLIALAEDKINYYAPEDAPYKLVVFSDGDEGRTAAKLTGKGERQAGTYTPQPGDMIYFVEPAVADFMIENPEREDDVVQAVLREADASFAAVNVTREIALNMAYNAKAASKSHSEKRAKKATNQAELSDSNEPAVATPEAEASSAESDTPDMSTDNTGEVASSATSEPVVTAYDPDALIGSQMPIVDADTIDDEPMSSTVDPGQPAPVDSDNDRTWVGVEPITEPLAQSAASQPYERTARQADKLAQLNQRVFAAEALAAAVTAKRGKGKLFGRKRATETIEARNEQLDKLERWTALLDKEQVSQWRQEGLSEDEVVDRLTEYQEVRAARRATMNKEEFTKGRFAKVMDRYANLPKAQKILVGLGAAGVIGAFGATIGAAAGATGLVAIAAAKVGKTYAQAKSKIYEDTGAALPAAERTHTVRTRDGDVQRSYTANELIGASARAERDVRRQSFERSDKITRNAAIVAGIGAVAVGAGILSHVGSIRDTYGDVTGGIKNWWDNLGAKGSALEGAAPLEADQIGLADGSTTEPIETPRPTPTPTPEPVPSRAAPEFRFSADASRIDAGEGWYQTFTEMGVTSPAEQAKLLQKVGPELVARGYAYPMADGTFGISRPGALPRDVLELIQKSR